jgi:hypothetical protein
MARPLAELVRTNAIEFESAARAMPALLEAIGDARLLLIGEATHGTHEFYRIRAELTKSLIRDHGFGLVAVEADWPDAYRVNRWVRGASEEAGAETALGDFVRFPRWMWRNADVVDFVRWLREHNVPGTSVTGTCWRRSKPCSFTPAHAPVRWCGRTIRTWATREPPRWVRRANSISVSLCASASGVKRY